MASLRENPFGLTQRELEVLEYMAQGKTNKTIAEEMNISTGTVHWYTKKIYSKMGVSSRTQASLMAQESGLLGNTSGQLEEIVYRPELPSYYSKFVGREAEIAQINDLLHRSKARLITITGHGGTGKTRLAVEVARQQEQHFADGIVFLSLFDTSSVYEHLRDILHRELRIAWDAEASYSELADKKLLIVLDNFEHIHEEREEILLLLEATNHVQILITSQVSLGFHQEYLIPLKGLDPSKQLADARQLFVSAAKKVQPQFSVEEYGICVDEICRLVDGVPLAIELAAAWLKMLSCEDILKEIRDNLGLLHTDAPDVPERHRSLQAVFEHAWRLLCEDEKRVLRRLSVLRGEFGLTAARQVSGTSVSTLASLVDRSLVHKTQNSTYQIHSLLRQYAEEKLRSGQEHGKQSKVALAMLSLLRGQLNKVEQIAVELMSEAADEFNVDKSFGLAVSGVIAGAQEDYDRCLQLCEASLAISEREPIALLFSYLGIAIGSCGQRDYFRAQTTIIHALTHTQALKAVSLLSLCLPVIALLTAHRVQPTEAVQIMSLMQMDSISLPDWLLKWKPIQQLEEELRVELGDATFDAHWSEGQSRQIMSIIDQFLADAKAH